MREKLLILFLFCSLAASGQISVIAQTGIAGNGTTATTTSINTTGAGITIVQVAEANVTAGTLSDNKGSTWVLLRSDAIAAQIINATYYCSPCFFGSGHTFSYTKTGSFASINVIALGNIATSPIDQQNGNNPASITTSTQPGSVTPTVNNEIVIASICVGNSGTVAINSGFTISHAVAFGAANNQGAMLAYSIQTSASAVNPTFSWPSSTFAASSIITLKPALNGSGFFILTTQ